MSVPNHMRMTALANAFNRGDINVTQRAAHQDNLFRLSPIAAGAAVLIMALGSAQAQTTPSTQPATQTQAEKDKAEKEKDGVQTITVTGIRRGIESAINVKKNSDSIVEAVSAEDIGKLPDVSIAESIARLPGLSAQRVAGRAQVISVRGLSPDFATTLLNGRELVSTGDNRSVEFDQYPSELLSGVTVYKTPDAALVGQGLSGTLDMQTVRPLNFSARTIALGARLSRNSLGSAANADANGERFSVSYIDQFADRTIGVAIGFAHQDLPVQENQVGLYEPWKTDARPGLPAGTFATDGIKALRRTGYSKRDGVMGTIEFRPSKDWTSTLDLFFSKAKQEDTANQWEMNTQYNGNFPCNPACTYSNVAVNGNGTLTGGTLTGVYPLVRGMYNKREDEISAIGLNNKFKLGDITLVADINYSKADRDELNLENNTQLVPSPQYDTVRLGYSSNGFSQMVPTLDYSDPTRLQLRGTIYGSGYGKVPSVKDELTGFKLVGSMPAPSVLGVISDIDVGLNYADRSKQKRQPEGNINVGAQGDTAIAADLQYGLVNLGFAGLGSIPSWNVPGAVARYMTFEPSATAFPYLVAKSWDVEEKTTTAFLKGNIDTDWGGINVRGNVGLQIQSTKQSSTAVQLTNGGTPQSVTGGKTDTDVLPSLNLAFGLGNDQTLRVALAKQIARPRVDQLRASIEVGVSDGPDTGGLRTVGASGGNPELDPWRATALDVSYEKYFGTKAYVAAAFFYKDLSSYIYTQPIANFDFSQFVAGIPENPAFPGVGIATRGTYSAPANGKGGKLQGLELTASLPFDLFMPALKGFGVVASASFNDSSIKIRDPESSSSVGGDNIELPGLSKSVFNLTAYYENGGFEARISQRRRSDFIGEIGNFNGNRTLRYVVGENIVDAQVGYNFTEGSLKGLGLLFQVNNLGDAAYRTYFAGNKDRPLEYSKWGRSYLVGANYKF
jgi:iron complex outermembrane recepter protein